ncbi:hypothetical protein OIV83_005368 [Microbotryomycetes sp. JL201]|nr:hypothetical protein OIV83_005368 [Microbotryomycetes sp. JL201]
MPVITIPRAVKESKPYPRAPFPAYVPTHPLLIIDFELIKQGDEAECQRLFEACSTLGFFYLKNHTVEDLVEPMFDIGQDTFSSPVEELLPYEMGSEGRTAGYKKSGGTNVDAKGNLDTVEFMNVAKDDALAFPVIRQRSYPSVIEEHMSTIREFISASDAVLKTIMAALEPFVGLAPGTLAKYHENGEPNLSGSEARLIYKPPSGVPGSPIEGIGEDGQPAAAIGSHTDFGSLSMLHSRGTGGLQVLPPGSRHWQYIKPIVDLAICNVGDTLSVYTGGIMRSNIHRVVSPPGDQADYARWSLVYFLRPSFDKSLCPLRTLSEEIAEAAAKSPTLSPMDETQTAGEWFARRVKGQRTDLRTGPESWKASRGTEHDPDRN